MRSRTIQLPHMVAGWRGPAVLLSMATVLVAGGAWLRRPGDLIEVRRGDIVCSFAANGRFESESVVSVLPSVAAPVKAVLVAEGASVKQGQALVQLDDSAFRAARDQALYARDAARARWEQVRKGTRSEVLAQAKARVDEFRSDWEREQARLREIRRPARSEDQRSLQAQVAEAEAEWRAAQKEMDRLQRLAKDGTATQSSLDEQDRQVAVAKAVLDSKHAQLSRLINGASDDERLQVERAVAVAAARLHQAQADFDRLDAGATAEERNTAAAEFQQAEATLREAQINLSRTRLVSPVAGTVIRKYVEPGEFAQPQMEQPLLLIADTGKLRFRIEVAEADVHKLCLGQIAKITADGYVGRVWEAKVTRIAKAMGKKALFNGEADEKTDVHVLEAWLTPQKPAELPLNLPIEAKVCQVRRRGVPVVPWRAVDSGGSVCLPDGTRQAITAGSRDESFVEVVAGLELGDVIRPLDVLQTLPGGVSVP